jgi:hypothetical protein
MNTRALIEKLKGLSPERIAAVEDFVDFLCTHEEEARDAAANRLDQSDSKARRIVVPQARGVSG